MRLPRYQTYDTFLTAFKDIVCAIKVVDFDLVVIGASIEDRPIYGLKLGNGSQRVLAWSQMHGNESTTTRALFKWLQRDDLVQILNDIELYIIPVLNPDGFENWTRVNANNIDLNRDAQALSQPESLVLRTVFNDFKPHYCFNLHDQRSIYGTPDGLNPVPLSFLAPAANPERSVTPSRLKAMVIINAMYNELAPLVNGKIGRYDDGFNNNCVGDYFQECGVPTILFEAGHAGMDYHRDDSVVYIEQAFTIALASIRELNDASARNEVQIIAHYNHITPVAPNFVDILIRNHHSVAGLRDLAIMYFEKIVDGILYFVPMLVGVNLESVLNAHNVIDLATITDFADDLIITDQLVITSESLGVLISQ